MKILLPLAILLLGSRGIQPCRAQVTGPRLDLEFHPPSQLQLRWTSGTVGFQPEEALSLAPPAWLPLAQTPVREGATFFVNLEITGETRYYRLRSQNYATLRESSPADGEQGVAVTRETVFRFDRPLAPSTLLTTNHVYASSGGRRLLSRVELSSDRLTATLFYLEPLPGSARVYAAFEATGLTDSAGLPLDPEGDGAPGGTAVVAFDTVSLTPVSGTAVFGRVFASELTPGPDTGTNAVNRPLPGVIITVDGAEERLRAVTDAAGNFRLDPAPAGTFFVHIDGRTAAGSQWPGGAYYPVVGKAWEGVPGRTTPAAGTGEIYLPLIVPGTLQLVSAVEDTTITFPPVVVAANPALAGVSITVPANALYGDNGTRGGMVGIAPVPPDRLPGPLPPGLEFPLVITVQTDGPLNFDRPAPVRFPNLPHPVTGEVLAPGEKSALWSFNHDTGQWEVVGPMTVSADGRFVDSDPGVGVRQPGWHGNQPGCRGKSRKGPAKPASPSTAEPPRKCPDEPRECPADLGPAKRRLEACTFFQAGETAGILGDATIDAFIGALRGLFGAGKKALRSTAVDKAKSAQECKEACEAFYRRCICQITGLPEFCTGLGGAPSPRGVGLAGPDPSGDAALDPALARLAGILAEVLPVASEHGRLSLELAAAIGDATREEDLTSDQRRTIQDLVARIDRLFAGEAPQDFYNRYVGLIDDTTTALGDRLDLFPATLGYYALENLGRGLVLRGRTGVGGAIDNLILEPNTRYRLRRYFADSGLLGEVLFVTGSSGTETRIPSGIADLGAGELGPDTDGDQLSDLAESVLGTDPAQRDTDGDGVSDDAEVQQGTNPLDGLPAATGVMATTPTRGPALDVAAFNALAVVAEGSEGVGVFNVFSGMNPTLVAQVDTPGTASAVALAGGFAAVADGPAGLTVIDVRDPAAPRLAGPLNLGTVRAVAASGSLAFAGLESGQLVAVDLATGDEYARVPTGAAVQDVAVEGDFVYVLTAANELQRYWLVGKRLEFRQRLGVSSDIADPIVGRKRLSVGGGQALVTRFSGFDVVDTRDPQVLRLAPAVFPVGPNSFKQIVQNGSGLGVAAVGVNPRNDGTHDVWLYDLSNPRTNLTFLTTLATPGLARALTLFNGLAYVADDTNGLQVVNYLAYDALRQPPTIALETPFTEGLAGEGQNARITASVSDDVQVRNVAFYLDGQLVAVDGNFPFEARFLLPRLTPSKTNITLQARATDTGGNSALSSLLVLALQADATPPAVLAFTPPLNALLPPGEVDTLTATFSEAVDPATLTAAAFRLVGAGADGELDTGDDFVIPSGTVTYRADLQTAVLQLSAPLGIGRYRAELSPALRDLAGNPLAPLTWELRVSTPVRWIREGDGFWDVAANWSGGVIPGPNDFVIIDRPGGEYTITYRSGDVTLARLDCAETLMFTGGRLTLLQPSTVAGELTLSGGRLGGPADLTVKGLLRWQGGEMVGGARTVAQGGLTLSGAESKVLSERILELEGAGTWRDPGPLIGLFGGTLTILPNATFVAENDSVVGYICCLGAGPTVNNYGTFRKRGGTGVTRLESTVFNNLGVVELETGSLRIGNGPGGVSRGEFRVAAGALLEFASDNYQLDPGSNFTGAGLVRQSRGRLTVGADVTVANLEFNDGTITGPGRLTVGAATWTGGNLTGTGTVEVPAGMTLTVSGNTFRVLESRAINNAGTILYTGSTLAGTRGGTIENLPGGLFEVRGDGGFGFICCDGPVPVIHNAGTFRKTAGANATQLSSITFDNDGLVEIETGRIELINSSGTQRGTVRVAADAVFKLDGGNHTLDGVTFTGAGLVRANANLTVLDPATAENFELFGNNLRGPGAFRITRALDWTGGNMVGPGTTEIAPDAIVTLRGAGGKALDGRTFNHAGTLVWTDSGGVAAFNGATFNNLAAATFEARNDAGFGYVCCIGAGPTFNNAGVVRKTGGASATAFSSTAFNNTGTIEVQTGRLEFNGCSGAQSSSVQLEAGTFLVLSGGNLVFNAASFTGAGLVRCNADVTVQDASSADHFELFGNRLRGPGTFIIRNSLDWTGGEMVGPALTEILAGALVTVRGGGGKSLDGRTLNNAGTLVWTDTGGIAGINGAVLNNLADGTFEMRTDAGFGYINFVGAIPTFNNLGTFRKTLTTGTSQFYNVAFTNSGRMELRQGTLNLTRQFDQTASGTLAIDIGGPVAGSGFGRLITGGPATLAGALTANLVNQYAPSLNDMFQVLTFASRTGQFEVVNGLPIGNGMKFQENYTATALTLLVVPE